MGIHCLSTTGNWVSGRCVAKGLFVRNFLVSGGVLCAGRPHPCEGSSRRRSWKGLGRVWFWYAHVSVRVCRPRSASSRLLQLGGLDRQFSYVHGRTPTWQKGYLFCVLSLMPKIHTCRKSDDFGPRTRERVLGSRSFVAVKPDTEFPPPYPA